MVSERRAVPATAAVADLNRSRRPAGVLRCRYRLCASRSCRSTAGTIRHFGRLLWSTDATERVLDEVSGSPISRAGDLPHKRPSCAVGLRSLVRFCFNLYDFEGRKDVARSIS